MQIIDIRIQEHQQITLSDKKFLCLEKIGEGGGSYIFKIVEDIEEADSSKEFALKICKYKNKPLAQAGRYCLLYTSPSPRDRHRSRMPSSA